MGIIWESINASNQHMLTHVPNGQIAGFPLWKKPRTPKIKRANKRCELGHSALKTVEQTRFPPEEARCVECIKIRCGEWCCRCRYNVRMRKQIETTDVYAGKGRWRAHISQSIWSMSFLCFIWSAYSASSEVHDFVNVWSQREVERGETNEWRHGYSFPCPRTSPSTPNDLLNLRV